MTETDPDEGLELRPEVVAKLREPVRPEDILTADDMRDKIATTEQYRIVAGKACEAIGLTEEWLKDDGLPRLATSLREALETLSVLTSEDPRYIYASELNNINRRVGQLWQALP